MRQDVHDPYRNWKFIAMILALAVLALCITGLLTDINVSVVFAALLMGASMCATSGIMALAKGRRAGIPVLCSGRRLSGAVPCVDCQNDLVGVRG